MLFFIGKADPASCDTVISNISFVTNLIVCIFLNISNKLVDIIISCITALVDLASII
jgi:hypothetical protein